MQPMITHRQIQRGFAALAAAALLGGCAIFRTPPPLTAETAYQRGMEAYQAGRYGRAAELLEQFAAVSAPDARLKEALMALAHSRMEQREYVAAANSYMRVVTQFAADTEAADARFGLCEAYYRQAPRPQLDQEYTQTAVAYCDSYTQYYPGTPKADVAGRYVVELRGRLAEKAYLNGYYYLRRGLHDASIVYFTRVLEHFPETAHAPAALARMVEAYDRMGYREEEEAARERLRREYPESPEARALAAAPAT